MRLHFQSIKNASFANVWQMCVHFSQPRCFCVCYCRRGKAAIQFQIILYTQFILRSIIGMQSQVSTSYTASKLDLSVFTQQNLVDMPKHCIVTLFSHDLFFQCTEQHFLSVRFAAVIGRVSL